MVRSLNLAINTNFTDVDFIADSLSPMQTEARDVGLRIEWRASELLTRQNVGIVMPQKLNPGPLAARMSLFAPVCLLFFFSIDHRNLCCTKNRYSPDALSVCQREQRQDRDCSLASSIVPKAAMVRTSYSGELTNSGHPEPHPYSFG